MSQSDHDAARALLLAALNAFGIRFESDDIERLVVEFHDHVRDGRLLAEATPPDVEPVPSARVGW
jgi:hypothetical protein